MIRDAIVTRMSRGVRRGLGALEREVSFARMHRAGVAKAKALRGSGPHRVQLGSGTRPKPGWVNVDLTPEADLTLDLRRALPFEDGSVEIFYSEHVLEHLEYPDAAGHLLRECLRALAPGGVASFAVPDMAMVLDWYVNGGDAEFDAAQKKWHPPGTETRMEHVNYAFRQEGDHEYGYDYETLRNLFAACGFERIERRDFDPGLDSEERRVGSLYVRAVKPGPAAV
jgi:predicted SAM-dependent methyltransferase